MATPTLWHLDISHFNEKARWALDYKGIPHVRKSVFPGAQELYARMLRGGSTTLPVIELDGKRIGDSTRIIAALEERWPDPPLYPSDPADRARALELEDFFDEHCAHELRRVAFDPLLREPELMAEALGMSKHRGGGMLRPMFPIVNRAVRSKYNVSPESAAEARRTVEAAMDRLEAEIQPSGYLVGDSFTVADLTAAAIMSPLTMPPEFPYHQIGTDRAPAELQDFRSRLEARPAFKYLREMYSRHRGVSAEVAAEADDHPRRRSCSAPP